MFFRDRYRVVLPQGERMYVVLVSYFGVAICRTHTLARNIRLAFTRCINALRINTAELTRKPDE